jgi:hypothetical protein
LAYARVAVLLKLLLSASLIAPAPAPAPASTTVEPPTFFTPPKWLHGVWSDGDGLLAVLEHGTVHLSCRTGERISLERMYGLLAVDGAWVDGAPVVAAVSKMGELVVLRGGAWSLHALPRDSTMPVAVRVDPRGRVVVANDRYAARRLTGKTWHAVPYPPGLGPVVALTQAPDGTLAVLASDGTLALAGPDSGQFVALVVEKLPRAPVRAWHGPGDDLWIAGDEEVVRVDVASARIGKRIKPDLFGGLRTLSGVTVPGATVIAYSAQSDIDLHDGARPKRLLGSLVFGEGLAFDLRGGYLLGVGSDGLSRFPLTHPRLLAESDRVRATPTPTCPLPTGEHTITLDSLRAVPKASTPPSIAALPIAEPPTAAPPTAAPPPSASDPVPRKKERATPSFRLGFGAAFSPAPTPPARVDTGFTLDVAVGAIFPLRKHVYLWPEFGYAYTVRASRTGHFYTAGVAPMFGNKFAQVGLAPRLVAGNASGAAGVGLRSGLVGSFGLNTLTVELGHQYLRVDGKDLHDGRFMLSINVLTLLTAVALVTFFGAIRRR